MKKVVVQMKRTLSIVLALMMVATTVPQAAMTVYADDAIIEAIDESIVAEEDVIVEDDAAVVTETADDAIIEDVYVEDSVEDVIFDDSAAKEAADEIGTAENEDDIVESSGCGYTYDGPIQVPGMTVKEKTSDGKEIAYVFDAYEDNGKYGEYRTRYDAEAVGHAALNVGLYKDSKGSSYHVSAYSYEAWEGSEEKYLLESVSVDGENLVPKRSGIGDLYYEVPLTKIQRKEVIVNTKKITTKKVKLTVKYPENSNLKVYLVKESDIEWQGEDYNIPVAISKNAIPAEGIEVNTVSRVNFLVEGSDLSKYKPVFCGNEVWPLNDSNIYYSLVGDSDCEISFVMGNPNEYAQKFTFTFDPGEGKFNKTKLSKEGKNPFEKDLNDLSKPIKYRAFARWMDGNYTGEYCCGFESYQNIMPDAKAGSGLVFDNWYEAKVVDGVEVKDENGHYVPDLTKAYNYHDGYFTEETLKDTIFVANYVKPLPTPTVKKIVDKTDKGFSFTVDINYDELKECYNPEAEVLMLTWDYATKAPNAINDEPDRNGMYGAWNGYDVMKSNGEQTFVVHDPTMPYVFEKPVTQDVLTDIHVRYVVIYNTEAPECTRHFINYNDKGNFIRASEYSNHVTFYISPKTYAVDVNNSGANLTVKPLEKGKDTTYFNKVDGYEGRYLLACGDDSASVVLTVTAANKRVPKVMVEGTELTNPTPVNGVYKYEIKKSDFKNTSEDGVNVISVSEEVIKNTVRVEVTKADAEITEARIGSLRHAIKADEVKGFGYQFEVTEGDTLTFTLTAKNNTVIEKLNEQLNENAKTSIKKINKSTYEYAVTPKVVNGAKVTVNAKFDTKRNEVVTVKQGEDTLKAASGKKYAAEYGIEYTVKYEIGNSAADAGITDEIDNPHFVIIGKKTEGNRDITSEILPSVTKDDNVIKFTIPATYAGETISFTSNDGKVEANFVVKASVSKITKVGKVSEKNGIFSIKQNKDTKVSYALTAKEKTATMNDLRLSVSGNGVSANLINGSLEITTMPSGDETNTITITRDESDVVLGKVEVTLTNPVLKFTVKKATADFSKINLTVARDKSVVKPVDEKTKVLYEVKITSDSDFGAVIGEEKQTHTETVKVKGNDKTVNVLKMYYETDFTKTSEDISIDVLKAAHPTDVKFDVEVSMIERINTTVSENKFGAKVYTGKEDIQASNSTKAKKSVTSKGSKAEKALKINKKLAKVTNYVSANAPATYIVATPKWSNGVNYKVISENVIVKKDGVGVVNTAENYITAKADEKNNISVTVSGNGLAAGEYELTVYACDGDGNSTSSATYKVEVVNSTMVAPTVSYPSTWLKLNNKATSFKATASYIDVDKKGNPVVKSGIPKGYKAVYTIVSSNGLNELEPKKSLVKINEKNGTVSIDKKYVLAAARDNIVVKAEIFDNYGNKIFEINDLTTSLIATSPKFGRLVAVKDTGSKYEAVRGELVVGNTYKFIVVKYGINEKAEYAYDEALENVTVASPNKSILPVVSPTELRAAKATAKNSVLTITATAGDGSKQKVNAKYKVR